MQHWSVWSLQIQSRTVGLPVALFLGTSSLSLNQVWAPKQGPRSQELTQGLCQGIRSVGGPCVTWRLHALGIQALPCFCPPLGEPPFPRRKLVHHRSCPCRMDHVATLSSEGGSHVWSLARRTQIKIPSFARRGVGLLGSTCQSLP